MCDAGLHEVAPEFPDTTLSFSGVGGEEFNG